MGLYLRALLMMRLVSLISLVQLADQAVGSDRLKRTNKYSRFEGNTIIMKSFLCGVKRIVVIIMLQYLRFDSSINLNRGTT